MVGERVCVVEEEAREEERAGHTLTLGWCWASV